MGPVFRFSSMCSVLNKSLNMSTFLLLFFVVGWLLLVLTPYLVDADRNIRVTKCCEDEALYWQGFDSCRNESEQSFFSLLPPVYSEDLNLIYDIKASDFNITTAMDNCSDGQIAVSTTKFKFIIDGSLRLDDDGRNFKVGRFCLSEAFGSAEIVARFCATDPCIEMNHESAGCIRKCCPNGMELNSTSFSCQLTPSPSFGVQFKNELGESVAQNISSYVIRDGVTPKCIYGTSPLGKAFDNEELFYILPNAHIYIPGYPRDDRMPSDYCIDTDGKDGVNYIYKNINGKSCYFSISYSNLVFASGFYLFWKTTRTCFRRC